MRWLGVTDALIVAEKERKHLQRLNSELRKQIQLQRDDLNKMGSHYTKFYNQMELIMKLTNVGLDISPQSSSGRQYDRSWACICLQGAKDIAYMKFVDLGDRDIRDIQEFLRRYEFDRRNVRIDGPFGMPRDFFF